MAKRSKCYRTRNTRSKENIASVRDCIVKNQETCSRTWNKSADSVDNKDMHFYFYKIQLTQELQESDHNRRRD